MICQKCNSEMVVDDMMMFRYGILEFYCIYDGYRAGEGYGTYTIEEMEKSVTEYQAEEPEEYRCCHCGDLLEGRYRAFTLYCKKPDCQQAKRLKWVGAGKKNKNKASKEKIKQ
jgi:hypothetical protein